MNDRKPEQITTLENYPSAPARNSTPKKNKRGGARPGGGRKRLPPELRSSAHYHLSLTPAEDAAIAYHAIREGISKNNVIKKLIRLYALNPSMPAE